MPRSWPRACHVQGCSTRPLNHAVFSPPDYSGSGGRSGGNSYGSGGSSYNPGSHGGYGGGSGGSSSYQGKQGGPGAAGGTAWGAPGHTQAMRRGVAAWARLQWQLPLGFCVGQERSRRCGHLGPCVSLDLGVLPASWLFRSQKLPYS